MSVGTRTISTLMHEMAQDHPHACGDKYFFDDFVKLG